MDTFEYKPMLEKYAGKQMPKAERTVGEIATFSAAPNRVIPPVAKFQQHGQIRALGVRSPSEHRYVRRRSGIHPRDQGR